MARLLIRRGVDIDHVNGVGMAPAHHLFQPFAPQSVDDELYTMLQSCGYSNLNVQNKAGETPLHRAACHGTASDVKRLLKLNADPNLRRPYRGWTPIYCAAFYDNADAFVELTKIVPEDPNTRPRWFTNVVDDRGWTLLHVVAERSSMCIARILLEAGADPFRLSSPSYEAGMCEEVKGQRVSPLFVAQHRGPDAIGKFAALLREMGHETYLDKEGDVFW
jgi:ankyrin repeat protein